MVPQKRGGLLLEKSGSKTGLSPITLPGTPSKDRGCSGPSEGEGSDLAGQGRLPEEEEAWEGRKVEEAGLGGWECGNSVFWKNGNGRKSAAYVQREEWTSLLCTTV